MEESQILCFKLADDACLQQDYNNAFTFIPVKLILVSDFVENQTKNLLKKVPLPNHEN
jgi:hypothetical protein